MAKRPIQYADDDTTSISRLVKMRLPSLAIGITIGLVLSFATSRFEAALSHDIRLAFFIPFVVYMADAVGTQTQNIYTRDLATGKANFKRYFIKEGLLGIILGSISSLFTLVVTWIWFATPDLTFAVSTSMFAATATAPLVSLTITELLELERMDPAVGAGPISTVIQDTLSVLIFGLVSSAILL